MTLAPGMGMGLDEELHFERGAQGCVTTCPPFMYSNTANRSPFFDGSFIVASTRSPVEMCENHWTPRLKKRRLHGELVQGRGVEYTNIPKI